MRVCTDLHTHTYILIQAYVDIRKVQTVNYTRKQSTDNIPQEQRCKNPL